MIKSEAKVILKDQSRTLSSAIPKKAQSHRLFHIAREQSPVSRTPQHAIFHPVRRQIGHSAPAPAQLISTSSAPRSEIHGNASQEAKELCARQLQFVIGANGTSAFGYSIARRLCISRVDVGKNPEEPRRTEAQVVCEITVESGM
ncbi:hypothetical protein BU17DRAFT_88448 [Hysterangium stoloniferum]|nr:hypothetical protein BU17DRAFT_88448 [Hysterangium stoloniferum]